MNTMNGTAYVPIQLLHKWKGYGLWDSGSSVSLMGSKLAKTLGTKITSSNVTARGVTGHRISLAGETKLHLTIGPNTLTHKFLVVKEDQDSVILGTDLMERLGPVLLDLEKQELRLKSFFDDSIQSIKLGSTPEGQVCFTVANIKIPPNKEATVALISTYDGPTKGSLPLFHPDEQLVCSPPSEETECGIFKTKLFNLSDKEIEVNQDSRLGTINIIEEETHLAPIQGPPVPPGNIREKVPLNTTI